MTTNLCLLQWLDQPVQEREYPDLLRQKKSPEHRLQKGNQHFNSDLKFISDPQKITNSAISILPLSPTVVGNGHCYEGTNGSKNLSARQSNLLKPDFYDGKNCHTNTLTLLWKTKWTHKWAQAAFTLAPNKNLNLEYIMIWLKKSFWDQGASIYFILIVQYMVKMHRQHYHSVGCWHIHREHWTQMPKAGKFE